MAVEKRSNLPGNNIAQSSWLRQLLLLCLCAPAVLPFILFEPLSCNSSKRHNEAMLGMETLQHQHQHQQQAADTVLSLGMKNGSSRNSASNNDSAAMRTDSTASAVTVSAHRAAGDCNGGLLGDLTSFAFWARPVSYSLLKWDTVQGHTHEVLPALNVSWATFGSLLLLACILGTTLFPLLLDALLRWSCNDGSLFSDAEICKRNSTLYTQPEQLQRHRRWWRNVRTFFFSRVGIQCLYISLLTATQGAVWILWAMQAGRVSTAAIHVKAIDIQIVDSISAMCAALIGNANSNVHSHSHWQGNDTGNANADPNVVASASAFGLANVDLSSAVHRCLALLVWALRSVVLQVFVMLLLADVASYGYHRLAHENRWLYRVVHSLHHQHYLPHHGYYALQFGAGLDMLFANPCFFIGVLLFPNTDGTTLTVFSLLSAALVTAGHTGADLSSKPWLHRFFHPEFHAAHHQKFTVNYAEHFTIVDTILGTYVPHAHAQ